MRNYFLNPLRESDPRKEQATQIEKAAKARFLSLGISLLLAVSLMMVPNNTQAGATKVALVDACVNLGVDFCPNEGPDSEILDFMNGFAILNIARDGKATLTVMVNKSVPDTSHSVYNCPDILEAVTLGNCDLIGDFITNINGTGAFFLGR